MRKLAAWIITGAFFAVALSFWGVWTYRLTTANQGLSATVEAQRQRNFSDMTYHVQQIQGLLGKGLVTGTTAQNMRYMSDVNLHAEAAATNFGSLPLPANLQASTGKFLTQIGDFAHSLVRNEAAGREMDGRTRTEMSRLRQESAELSARLQSMANEYGQGGFRWTQPLRFSWRALVRQPAGAKPPTGAQAPANLAPGGWEQVGSSMEKLPVMLYDGPFSDSANKRAPALAGPPLSQTDAATRLARYIPGLGTYRSVGVAQADGNLPTYSFQLAPASAPAGAPYTLTVDVSRNGGFLVQMLNDLVAGTATMDLARARDLGTAYLTSIGYTGMHATYGQVADGTATIAYAYHEDGVTVYPDQVKLKIGLDNGEILAVDARQYVMSHHLRAGLTPTVTAAEARDSLNPALNVQRTQLALIPNHAGTGEILTWEFLTNFGNELYLVYVNADTGAEEQILQQVETDGGTFAL